MNHTTLIAMTTAALFGAPAVALAQDAALDAYGGKGEVVLGITESTPPGVTVLGESETTPTPGIEAESTPPGVSVQGESESNPQSDGSVNGATDTGTGVTAAPAAQVTATESAPAGALPFTGLDLGLIALGGAMLIAIGIGARRLSRPVVN